MSSQVRYTFGARTIILEGFTRNFKNCYLGEQANCEGCNQVLDTQGHVVECDEYADIEDGLDLSKDSDLFLCVKKKSWKWEVIYFGGQSQAKSARLSYAL